MTKPTIRIGLDQAAPIPLHTTYSSALFEGFEVDLLQQLAVDLHFDISYTVAQWDELLSQLDKGSLDAVCSAVTVTEERKKHLHFSHPYLQFHLCVVCRKDHLLSVPQLHEHPVGVRAGTTAEYYLVNELHHPPTVSSHSNDDLYNLLLNGIIHAVVEDSPIAQGYINKHRELAITSLLPGSLSEYAIAFNSHKKVLQQQINDTLLRMDREGYLQALRQKWFGDEKL